MMVGSHLFLFDVYILAVYIVVLILIFQSLIFFNGELHITSATNKNPLTF